MSTLLTGRRTRIASALLILLGNLAAALPGYAEIALRVAASPQTGAIEAFVLATDGGGPVTGLVPEDFAVTLDGAPVGPFDLALPGTEDPAQKTSVVIVANHGVGHPPANSVAYVSMIERMAPGDFVAVVLSGIGSNEGIRYGEVAVLPFRALDGGAHSEQVISFLETGQSSVARVADVPFPSVSRRGFNVALAQFETHSDRLPDGPRAIVSWSIPTSDLGRIIDRANQQDASIFTRLLVNNTGLVAQSEAQRAVAAGTGGAAVPVFLGSGSALPVIGAWLKDSYHLTIPGTVADDCGLHMLEVTVGDEVASAPFVRCDATPEPLFFPTQWNIRVSEMRVSEALAIEGITSPAPITIYDGEYSIGCSETFTSEPGYIQPGEEICVRHMHEPGRVQTKLFVGGVESRFVTSSAIEP